MIGGLHAAGLMFHFPWIIKVLKALPIFLTARISEGYALYIKEHKVSYIGNCVYIYSTLIYLKTHSAW
jgi:hypothetical protein